jgi:hypothetical protein
MRSLRRHLTYANVVATLALVIAVGGGAAYAANTVFSSDIVDGEVKEADIGSAAVREAEIGQGAVNSDELKNDGVLANDLAPDAVRAAKVLDGTLGGADVAGNSLKGADIDEATLDIGDAARAYALVDPGLCTGTPGTCQAEQTKGVTTVTRDATGQYCVVAPGIDSAATPAAVTVDWGTTAGPEGNASAMTREVACGPQGDGFEVYTERQPLVAVDQGGNVGAATVSGLAAFANDVGFTIVIP